MAFTLSRAIANFNLSVTATDREYNDTAQVKMTVVDFLNLHYRDSHTRNGCHCIFPNSSLLVFVVYPQQNATSQMVKNRRNSLI